MRQIKNAKVSIITFISKFWQLNMILYSSATYNKLTKIKYYNLMSNLEYMIKLCENSCFLLTTLKKCWRQQNWHVNMTTNKIFLDFFCFEIYLQSFIKIPLLDQNLGWGWFVPPTPGCHKKPSLDRNCLARNSNFL